MIKATEVFTPGRFPAHTFVEDHLVKRKRQLLDALDAGAMLVSISGPSKSGKTVFVEEVLGKHNLIQITGAGAKSATDLWLSRLLKYFRLQSTAPACEPLCSEPPQIYWRPEHARSRHLHREPVHAQPA